jgi:hypothetical protein
MINNIKNKLKTSVLFVVGALSLASCSSTPYAVKVTAENREELEGVFFYEPQAYLLIGQKPRIVEGKNETTDKDGVRTRVVQNYRLPDNEMVASIIYLKNAHKEYCLMNAENVHLKDGWRLEGFGKVNYAAQEEGKLLETLSGAEGLEPGLYSLSYSTSGIMTGLRKVHLIEPTR